MPRYLICVMHEAGAQSSGAVYADEAAMQDAFRRVGEFNDRIESEGRLVLAGGLMPREQACHLDPASGPDVVDGPLVGGERELGGFWILDADDDQRAREDLAAASGACGQALEMRRFQG